MKKRLFSAMLVLCMVLTLLPIGALAARGNCGKSLYWSLFDDGILTIYGTGDMWDYSYANETPWHRSGLEINALIIENGITSVGEYAFANCANIISVAVPNGVTSIGSEAFCYCTNLSSITIPDSVTSIGNSAFRGCTNLSSITIPDGITSISETVFTRCTNLTSITIPNSVISIGSSAFAECTSLSSVIIPDSVTSIGLSAFNNCTSLTDVYYASSEENWEKISIAAYNDALLNATIHYNSVGPDSGDSGNDSETNSYCSVRYFSSWDAENQIAYFGELDLTGSQVTEETNTAFLENIETLIGNYVLVETKAREDNLVAPDTLLSITPVETKTGTITTAEIIDATLAIDGVQYPISERLLPLFFTVGDKVMYHLHDGKIVGISEYDGENPDNPTPEPEPEPEYQLVITPESDTFSIEVGQELELTCTLYRDDAQVTIWDRPQISIGHNGNEEPIAYLGCEGDAYGSYNLKIRGIQAGTAVLTISDSASGAYANISVEVVPMETISVKYWDDLDNQEKSAEITWGYGLFREDARNIADSEPECFAELVKISALLSKNTYDFSDGGHLQQMLSQLGAENIEIALSEEWDFSYPVHSISHVKFQQDDLVIVTIRGSVTPGDWLTDFKAWAGPGFISPKEHPGFSDAKDTIKDEIKTYLFENHIVASESKILIAGHSYGGAVANLLANSLKDVFDQSNIYAYTFAAPNTVVIDPMYTLTHEVESNIHNFRNAWDPVVRLPFATSSVNAEKYTVFGLQHFFKLEEIGDESEGIDVFDNHYCTHYVNYAFDLVEHTAVESLPTRCVQIHCPVDVTAYDENGNIVGKITDDTLDEDSTSIMMYPVSDQKHVFIDQDDTIQLSITATDSGTMDVIITDYDVVTGDVSAVKTYSGVALEEGKDFYTCISPETTTEDIELAVVDDEGNRLAIVNEDGTETVETPEHIHTYGEPTFTWADDYSSCTATFVCVNGDDTQTVDCTVTSETTPATDTEPGETVYTATVEFNGKIYSDTKSVEIPVIEVPSIPSVPSVPSTPIRPSMPNWDGYWGYWGNLWKWTFNRWNHFFDFFRR